MRVVMAAVAILMASGAGAAGLLDADDIEVEIVSERGAAYPVYPIERRGPEHRAYLEARPYDRYRIRVRNLRGTRVGVVIAVDGRNIISGARSELDRNERMYILEPYASASYAGWRTGRNKVNRFYFTEADDSYAGAFDDYSAMGVIAVAAYPERGRARRVEPWRGRERMDKGAAEPMHEKRSGDSSLANESEPGTGFGEDHYSPSIRVSFEPVRRAVSRIVIKYEWRETLCELGVASCYRRNRMWPEEYGWRGLREHGYAPPPPPRRWRQK